MLQHDDITTDAAADMLTRGILDTAAFAGFAFGGSGSNKYRSFPLSAWFDAECKTLRKALLQSRRRTRTLSSADGCNANLRP